MEKAVCFIGHRNTPDTDDLREKIAETIERLINEEGAARFLFGSRSSFDSICHEIVTGLQESYPHIERVAYTCRQESAVLKEDKKEKENMLCGVLNRRIPLKDYDTVYEHPTKYTAGKACYIERNRAMIDDSDFCVFYFDENYLPPRKRTADRQSKSGTAAAYGYAVKKKKAVINLCVDSQ